MSDEHSIIHHDETSTQRKGIDDENDEWDRNSIGDKKADSQTSDVADGKQATRATENNKSEKEDNESTAKKIIHNERDTNENNPQVVGGTPSDTARRKSVIAGQKSASANENNTQIIGTTPPDTARRKSVAATTPLETARRKSVTGRQKSARTPKDASDNRNEKLEKEKIKDKSDRDKDTGDGDNKGSDLLLAVKNKNMSVALKLIDEGADIHFVDETKRNVLHYASQAGFDDLIMKLVSVGGNVKLWDCNSETPLHKASRVGHDTTAVALVACGADVNVLNRDGRNPLELAVMGKHFKVVEVLLSFGADLVMQNWDWLEETKVAKSSKDKDILELFKKYYKRAAGFKHGGICYNVSYVEPEKEITLKSIGLTLTGKDVPSAFYFYCCKLQAEYTNVKQLMKENEQLFSDIYECRQWGSVRKVLTLDVKLVGVPMRNETIEVIFSNGKIGRTESIFRNEDENYTLVRITMNLKPNTTTSFMFVTLHKPEVFAITKEAVTIQPQMEPEAEIDIPKDTFDAPGDLLLNVVETQYVNVDVTESNEVPVLVTNVIDLSMSNHQQPKQPIDMKLPLHFGVNAETKIVMLASSKEFPETIDDWEIVDATTVNRKTAFKIGHFSIYTGVQKEKVEKDMKKVIKLIEKALNNERQVEFFVLVRTVSKDEYTLVLECAMQRKAKQRRKQWRKKGYEDQEVESFSITVQVNSWYRVSFEENVQRIGQSSTNDQKLMFNANRENFQIYSVEMVDSKKPPIGRVKIESIIEREQEPESDADTGCWGRTSKPVPRQLITEYSNLTVLPIRLVPPSSPPGPEELADNSIPVGDHQCMIKTLRISSLMQLSKRLDMNEIKHFAIQLKQCNPSDVDKIAEMSTSTEDFLRDILRKWRGVRPYQHQIDTLIHVLEGMNKVYEADEVRNAQTEDREIRFM